MHELAAISHYMAFHNVVMATIFPIATTKIEATMII